MSSIDTYQQLVKGFREKYASEFFKHSATLVFSNVISLCVALISYPFITRIYSPETFGEFSFFLSIAGILTVLCTARYEDAILIPSSDSKAIALFQLCILLAVVFSALLFLIVAFWSHDIARLFGRDILSEMLPFLPLLVLLGGGWQAVNALFIRQKRYYNIGTYNIVQSLSGAGAKCLLGLKGFFSSGLIWGALAGLSIATVTTFFKSGLPWHKIKRLEKAEMRDVAKTYANFPKFELPNDLLNTLTGNLPILLLSVYFDMQEIGLFSLAITVGLRPISLLGSSVYQVLFGKISECVRQQQPAHAKLLLFCKACTVLLLPFFILALFTAEWLFVRLFGQEWQEAGFYLKQMLPWLFMIIITTPLSFVPELFFRQKTAMYIEVAYVICRLIALLTGIYLRDIHLAIMLYCSISTVMLIVKLAWYLRLMKKYELTLNER